MGIDSLSNKTVGDIYIYGAGELGQLSLKYLLHSGVTKIAGFIVSDGREREIHIGGVRVYYLSEVKELIHGKTILLATGKFTKSILEELQKYNLEQECKLFVLDEDDFLVMNRVVNPIDDTKFMYHANPADPYNGGSRGTTVSRYYIKRFLDYACGAIPRRENLKTYEVGDARYSNYYYPNAYHGVLDYKAGQDLTKNETLPKGEFDIFFCTQVYNFLFDVPAAISGSRQVLKDDGYLLCTVVGNVSQVIRGDMEDYGDYWRFTHLGIRRLIERFFDKDKIEIISYGNAMATTAYIQGMCVEDLPRKELLDELDPEYALVIGIIARK